LNYNFLSGFQQFSFSEYYRELPTEWAGVQLYRRAHKWNDLGDEMRTWATISLRARVETKFVLYARTKITNSIRVRLILT